MLVSFTHHEGTQKNKPLAVDTESSNAVVYIRKNIEQITHTDKESGEEITVWSYDEAELSLQEYMMYLGEDNASKIEYVAMMSDIDLEEI